MTPGETELDGGRLPQQALPVAGRGEGGEGTASIDAVLIDADGVLQRTPQDWYDVLLDLGGAGFPEACFEIERPSLRGEGNFREHLQTYLDTNRLTCTVDDVLTPWLRIELDHGAMAVVAQVRAAGTRCYLATNQQSVRAAHMREVLRYEDVLDGCFYSYELKAAKPDPAYWERIAERLDLAPERLLFVDDRSDNVAAARSVGLAAEEVPQHDHGATLRRIFTAYGLLTSGTGHP